MSKTFKSMHPDSVLSLQVGSNHDGTGVHVAVLGASGLQVAKSDAPAIALAILEAAGIVPAHHSDYQNGTPEALEHVAQGLKDEIDIAEAEAKEAADREALEAEAWELYKVWNPGTDHENFASVPETRRAEWIAVAKRARTFRGPTK